MNDYAIDMIIRLLKDISNKLDKLIEREKDVEKE